MAQQHAVGVNHLSGLFLPLAAFPGLKAGQRIDVDDISGAKVIVTFAGLLENGRPGVTSRVTIGDAFWSETSFDQLTGVAVQVRGFSGPSPFYYTRTEMSLVEIPTMPPTAPRLEIIFDPEKLAVTISFLADAGTIITLERSTDGARSWTAVPGYEGRVADAYPIICEIKTPTGMALFRARAGN